MADKYINIKHIESLRDRLSEKSKNYKEGATKKGMSHDYCLGISGEAELCAGQLTSLIDNVTKRGEEIYEEIQCTRCNKALPRIIKLNPGGAVDPAYCQECFGATHLYDIGIIERQIPLSVIEKVLSDMILDNNVQPRIVAHQWYTQMNEALVPYKDKKENNDSSLPQKTSSD